MRVTKMEESEDFKKGDLLKNNNTIVIFEEHTSPMAFKGIALKCEEEDCLFASTDGWYTDCFSKLKEKLVLEND